MHVEQHEYLTLENLFENEMIFNQFPYHSSLTFPPLLEEFKKMASKKPMRFDTVGKNKLEEIYNLFSIGLSRALADAENEINLTPHYTHQLNGDLEMRLLILSIQLLKTKNKQV